MCPRRGMAADRGQWRGYLFHYRVSAGSNLRVAGDCSGDDHDPRTVALWPKVLDPWITPLRRRALVIPPLMDGCPGNADSPSGLRIVGLSNGGVYRGLGSPRRAPLIELKAVGARGELHWYIDGRLRYSVSPEQTVRHRLAGKGTRQVLCAGRERRGGQGGDCDSVSMDVRAVGLDPTASTHTASTRAIQFAIKRRQSLVAVMSLVAVALAFQSGHAVDGGTHRAGEDNHEVVYRDWRDSLELPEAHSNSPQPSYRVR